MKLYKNGSVILGTELKINQHFSFLKILEILSNEKNENYFLVENSIHLLINCFILSC